MPLCTSTVPLLKRSICRLVVPVRPDLMNRPWFMNVGHAEPVPGRRARRFAAALSGLPLEPVPTHAGYGRCVTGGAAEMAARGIAAPDGIIAHLSALNLRHKLIGAA